MSTNIGPATLRHLSVTTIHHQGDLDIVRILLHQLNDALLSLLLNRATELVVQRSTVVIKCVQNPLCGFSSLLLRLVEAICITRVLVQFSIACCRRQDT